jgi:hypothetical protein
MPRVGDGVPDFHLSSPEPNGGPPSRNDGVARSTGAESEGTAAISYGPFNAWDPSSTSLMERRPGPVSIIAAIGAVVLLFVAALLVGGSADSAGRDDPNSVATLFVRRYAVHDPAACELVTSALRTQLQGEGRCVGPVRGTSPQIGVMASQACGGVHHFDAVVAPEGEFGKRFVSIGLERAGGAAWVVRSVLPIGDCRVLVPSTCQ